MKSGSIAIRQVLNTVTDVGTHIVSHRHAQQRAALAAFGTDFLSVSIALGAMYGIAGSLAAFEAVLSFTVITSLAPLLVLGLLVAGLYSPLFVHPVQEIKLSAYVTALVGGLSTGLLAVYGAPAETIIHTAAIGALLLVLVPISRGMMRVCLGKTEWWGMPVVIFSNGKAGARIVELLRRWPELGLRPALIAQNESGKAKKISGVPVLQGSDVAARFAQEQSVGCAIVARPDLDHHALGHLLDQQGKYFKHMFVVPKSGVAQCMWSTADSYDGLVGFAVQHYSWRVRIRSAKKLLDRVGAAIGLVAMLPLMLVIAAWIKMDSDGPVFFKQERMGRSGRCFKVYKFRTMYKDAEARLEELLSQNPALREEYRLYHKLQDDPRVTGAGRFLRRYSIDELPQLINVLRGEMSFVGPRAYMPGELSKMNGMARAVLKSRPGLTGLWQVSGRNHLSFEERVDLDVHYLQNWSPWLDLYILIRTIPVVATGDGAR